MGWKEDTPKSNVYCWICYTNKTNLRCTKCPRHFHAACVKSHSEAQWICNACKETDSKWVFLEIFSINVQGSIIIFYSVIHFSGHSPSNSFQTYWIPWKIRYVCAFKNLVSFFFFDFEIFSSSLHRWKKFDSTMNNPNTQSTFHKWSENHTKHLNNSKMISNGLNTIVVQFIHANNKYKIHQSGSLNMSKNKLSRLNYAKDATKTHAHPNSMKIRLYCHVRSHTLSFGWSTF